jgi:hypothetical protein
MRGGFHGLVGWGVVGLRCRSHDVLSTAVIVLLVVDVKNFVSEMTGIEGPEPRSRMRS